MGSYSRGGRVSTDMEMIYNDDRSSVVCPCGDRVRAPKWGTSDFAEFRLRGLFPLREPVV
jgi:hypothetical protein